MAKAVLNSKKCADSVAAPLHVLPGGSSNASHPAKQGQFSPKMQAALANLLAQAQLEGEEEPVIATNALGVLIDRYVTDVELSGAAKATIQIKKGVLGKFRWFAEKSGAETIGLPEIQAWLDYILHSHESGEKRWGSKYGRTKAPSQATVRAYFIHVQAFYSYLVREKGILSRSPFDELRKPPEPEYDITPFSKEQVRAIFAAGQKVVPHGEHKFLYPERNMAMLWLLYDTGIRRSELLALNMGDIDIFNNRAQVMGKGKKKRSVFFGRRCAKVISKYMRSLVFQRQAPLFVALTGSTAGERCCKGTIQTLFEAIEIKAQITGVRCSAHTFRHTFAIEYLRRGGDVFALKMLMGHSNIAITERYVRYVNGDLESQHRRFSPGDWLDED